MTVTLNVAERVAIIAALRSKKSEDIQVLLDFRNRANTFRLNDDEKKKVEWSEVGERASYKSEADGEQFRLDREFDLSEDDRKVILNQLQQLAGKGMLSASNDNVLAVYEKLTAA